MRIKNKFVLVFCLLILNLPLVAMEGGENPSDFSNPTNELEGKNIEEIKPTDKSSEKNPEQNWKEKVKKVVEERKMQVAAVGATGTVAGLYGLNDKFRNKVNGYFSKMGNAIKNTYNNYGPKKVMLTLGGIGTAIGGYFGFKKANEKYELKSRFSQVFKDRCECCSKIINDKLPTKKEKITALLGTIGTFIALPVSYFIYKKYKSCSAKLPDITNLDDKEEDNGIVEGNATKSDDEKSEMNDQIEEELDKNNNNEFDDVNYQWRNGLMAFVGYLTEKQKQIDGIIDFLTAAWDNPLILDKKTEVSEGTAKVRDEFLSSLNQDQKDFVNEIIALYKSILEK